MKKVMLLLATLALCAIIISVAFVVLHLSCLLCLPADPVAVSEWTDACHGAVMFISLATDARWVTNRTYKITFLFAVKNVSGCPNATTFYNNSHVILNSVKLDPSYIDMSESLSKKHLEKEAWSVDWYFTPKADDYTLACLGISRGKEVKYSLSLEVNYTVVDSNGVEWPCLLQATPPEPCLTVTIAGA
jgi:hypothetical protein